FSEAISFVPEARAGHVAIVIENQLYFMGGSRFIPSTNQIKSSIRVYNLSDEVFSLNLSSQFSTSSPPYVDLTGTSARMKYASEKGTVVLRGVTNESAYLIGGVQQNLTRLNEIDHNATITSNQALMIDEISKTYTMTDQFIFFYQSRAEAWSYPLNNKGTPPSRRRSTATISKNGIIYIFGGRVQVDTGSPTFICYNDLYTFDPVLVSWNKINADNAPSPRSHAAPVLLPNGKILYIGGVSQTDPGKEADLIDMNEIPVFDTISSTWSYKYASQSIRIQPRVAHTATLTPDNNEIIIIGGNSSNITNNLVPPVDLNSLIYILDIPCKTWVTTFTPGKSICSIDSKGLNIGEVVGITIAGCVGLVAIIALIYFLVTRCQFKIENGPEPPE
ncbi:2479_t:CDS:2, partial [Cetraspora pellucida]